MKTIVALLLVSSPFVVCAQQSAPRIRSIIDGKEATPLSIAPVTTCIADYVSASPAFRVKATQFPASPSGGQSGDGLIAGTSIKVEDFGAYVADETGKLTKESGIDAFKEAELVVVKSPGDFGHGEAIGQVIQNGKGWVNVDVRSALRHNVTRGKGNFQHESPEYFNSLLRVPLVGTCESFKLLWNSLFAPATLADLAATLKQNPSGVLVDELKEGMTPVQVESQMGAPDRKATVGGKLIYFYPKMKLTFVNGKLMNID